MLTNVLLFIISILLVLCLYVLYKKKISYDGKMIIIVPEEGPKIFSLEFDGDPGDLEHKRSVTFKVIPKEAMTVEEL